MFQVSEVEISEGGAGWSAEEVVSSLKIYAPSHVLEDPGSFSFNLLRMFKKN
jgi:hypothetical protein